ncbi:ABC transporter [Streptomyces sp. WM4235]|uniref:ATP-binding cassette domain-containing protein n=1 Tax=unclassified Streptomyces TaxID=2593676 RepID=UPI0006C1350C|nr:MULTISPECIES: ATP-binding cassette domain-containing protein [unclassified Streptomyces]KOU38549.1 ABC transporter [Streptomyces sp. WM4235]MCX5155690.1 ATP-binding cassette domain-containing protein [Streptomyces sp. NBC_00291]
MRLTEVGRRHGRRRPWVLRGVSMELPPGALIRVEGRNGDGKSTLLRLVAGIDTPTEGRITGRPLRTAYVPERFPAALPLTAAAYLTRMGAVHGLPRATAADRAAGWLERFGAAEYARTPLVELSKGSAQKVAVAQALLADPALLVLDEAWTGLDTAARGELDRAVLERTAAGGTVLFVDHDPRRLVGAADARHRIEDAALVPAPPEAGGEGPCVRVHVTGPPGATPPPGLSTEPAPDGGLLLTVPAARSDAALRALLTADPPWHVRGVRELP